MWTANGHALIAEDVRVTVCGKRIGDETWTLVEAYGPSCPACRNLIGLPERPPVDPLREALDEVEDRILAEHPPVDPLREAALGIIAWADADPVLPFRDLGGRFDALRAALASPSAPRPEGLDELAAALGVWMHEDVSHDGHLTPAETRLFDVAERVFGYDRLARLSDTGGSDAP